MCVFSEACLMYMNDRRVDEGLRRLHSHKGRWQMVVQFLNRCWTVVSVSLGDMSARYFNHTSRVYMYPRSVRLPAAFTGVFLSRVQVEAELRAAVVWADVHGAPQFTAYLCSHGLGGGECEQLFLLELVVVYVVVLRTDFYSLIAYAWHPVIRVPLLTRHCLSWLHGICV